MSEAETKPSGTSWSDIPTKGWVALGAVILVAVIAVTSAVVNRGPNTGSEQGSKSACHTFVKDRLKSPSTAKFGGELATGPGPRWMVSGDVDSQNSFGGVVRNHFVCSAQYANSGDWRLVNLDLTGS